MVNRSLYYIAVLMYRLRHQPQEPQQFLVFNSRSQ